MTKQALAVAVALILPVCAPAVAQDKSSDYKALQRTLEEKFAPRATRSLAKPQPAPVQKDEYQWIKPKDGGAKSDTDKAPGKQSSVETSWFRSLFSYFSGNGGEAETIAVSNETGPAAVEAGTSFGDQPQVRSLRTAPPASGPVKVAENEVPVAKKNSFVIQLKPNASEKEISALLKKYNLEITKLIAPLGVITVKVINGGATRGLNLDEPSGGGGEAADPKAKLQKILEPPIIQELRKEPAVDGAFVNSTMGPKRLPAPSSAKVTVDGTTYSWRWYPGEGTDGNWGLKAIRVPPVWNILEAYRKANPDLPRPKVGIIDGGFADNPAIKFNSTVGVRPFSFHTAGCGTHHGMHVAGIIGAAQSGAGIDGIVPGARMDAIALDDSIVGDAGAVGVDEGWEVHTLLFDDVLAKTLDYVYENVVTPDNLRVINVSLGYNFVAGKLLGDADPSEVPGLALHILHQANLIRQMALRVEDRFLFVVAAGNDSQGRATPLDTKWASPFAWAATQDTAAGERPKNILVVEAVDRAGKRAEFSDTGGQVSAPGVDIMSTLAGPGDPLGVCSGTSQAAPYVSGLAALLFELDPTKSPAEVADLIKATAAPMKDGGGAPTIDALEAVLKVTPAASRLAADLNRDGKVDETDMGVFSRQLAAIDAAAETNAAFTEDLNGDGAVDDNECFWPEIDFNGNGQGGASVKDASLMSGRPRPDVEAFALAWSDNEKTYDMALNALGLAKRVAEVLAATSAGAAPPTQCRGVRTASGAQVAETSAADTPPGGATRSLGITSEGDGATRLANSSGAASAAGVKSEVEGAVSELKRSNPSLKVTINPQTGLPSSISGIAPAADTRSLGAATTGGELTEEETRLAVDRFFGATGVRSVFPTKNNSARHEYVGRRRDPDFPGRYIAEVEQRVDGVPVFGSTSKLTVERSLGVTKYSGNTSNVAVDSTTPKIVEAEAVSAARTKLETVMATAPDASRAFPLPPDPQNADAKAQLIVFDPALVGAKRKGSTRLAWMVTIQAFRVFVDANTGEAFYYYRDQPSGMVRRVYDLASTTTFPGTKIIDEETRERIDDLDPDALLAFHNAGLVRDFYFLVFGRDGYDDNDGPGPLGGSALEAYVRFGNTQGAFWCPAKSYDCPKGNVMVYGPGFASAVDIVAHEMTHGIISHEKNLLYLNEPGAVNESLADIFGSLIELNAKGEGGNWLIGESAPGFSTTAPLRSLANPNLADENGKSMFDRSVAFSLANRGQPDNYAEVLTPDDPICGSTSYEDNGCVHFNSGILNKFAYLIAEGGEHRGVKVTGIGRAKLARIAYRAMTAGLNQSSDLLQAAQAFSDSCLELANGKLGGFIPDDCKQVTAAQQAVGLLAAGS